MMLSLWWCVDRSLDWCITLWNNNDNLKGQCFRSKHIDHKKNRGWNSNFFFPQHDISPWSEKNRSSAQNLVRPMYNTFHVESQSQYSLCLLIHIHARIYNDRQELILSIAFVFDSSRVFKRWFNEENCWNVK